MEVEEHIEEGRSLLALSLSGEGRSFGGSIFHAILCDSVPDPLLPLLLDDISSELLKQLKDFQVPQRPTSTTYRVLASFPLSVHHSLKVFL